MDDFLMRTVLEEYDYKLDDEEYGIIDSIKLKVSRTRTSKGHSSIQLCVGSTCITFNSDDLGGSYEMVAKKAIDMLDNVSNNPCSIPALNTKD